MGGFSRSVWQVQIKPQLGPCPMGRLSARLRFLSNGLPGQAAAAGREGDAAAQLLAAAVDHGEDGASP
jgi:hypothetical protein